MAPKLAQSAKEQLWGLTHGHWYVCPVQGTLLRADPLLVEHHSEIILTHGHFSICQRCN